MKTPWHESSDNVLALARWYIADRLAAAEEERNIDRNVRYLLMNPSAWEMVWQEYQSSLKPAEPKLSERMQELLDEPYFRLHEVAKLTVELAQRLEALEEKMGGE